MKCKNRRQDGVYQILDRLEKERRQCVKLFWECVFKNHILQKYSVLRLLRNSLKDGSFRYYLELPDAEEQDSTQGSEDKANEKKRKKSSEGTEEQEKPGPSPFSYHSPKKSAKKPMFTSPLRKGEKVDIWMWDFYKAQLPVTCGDKKGTLFRDKLGR
ncbi:nuclear body protein SP140-like protein, partial [Tachysurus ichikawai]